MIEVEKAATYGLHEAGFPGSIGAVEHDDSGGQILQIELGNAAPVFEVNGAENHDPIPRAIW